MVFSPTTISLEERFLTLFTSMQPVNFFSHRSVGASVIRDGVYSTFRIGAYEPVKGVLGAEGIEAPLWKKMVAGALVGSLGSAICTPTDLVMIRMQGEGKLPTGKKTAHW